MGITGLLQALKPLIQPAHISHFAGKNVAVDGYSWLHKAIYGCCVEICNGNDSDAWIQYCLSFLDVLLDHKLQVIMVFDGDSLPAKSKTELERSESRSSSLNKARALAASGDHKQARSYFSRAVDVTPQMASDLIFVIRSTRPQVQCIVAPYEADAQLAYLSQIGKVDCVISEDSDNIPYGCKQIIFKFERDGSCQTLLLQDIYEKPNDKFDLRSFTQEMVVVMCILAGCDYLDSIKGIGLKNSHKMVSKYSTASNVLKAMRLSGQLPLISATGFTSNQGEDTTTSFKYLQYELEFYKAYATFYHQVVYDPILKKTVHRTALTTSTAEYLKIIDEVSRRTSGSPENFAFLGVLLEDDVSKKIADGLLHPSEKTIIEPSSKVERILRPAMWKFNGSMTSQAAIASTNIHTVVHSKSTSMNLTFSRSISMPAKPPTVATKPPTNKIFEGWFKKVADGSTQGAKAAFGWSASSSSNSMFSTSIQSNTQDSVNNETKQLENFCFDYDEIDDNAIQNDIKQETVAKEYQAVHIQTSATKQQSILTIQKPANGMKLSNSGKQMKRRLEDTGPTKLAKGKISSYFTTSTPRQGVDPTSTSSSAKTTQEIYSDLDDDNDDGDRDVLFIDRLVSSVQPPQLSPSNPPMQLKGNHPCVNQQYRTSTISYFFAGKGKHNTECDVVAKVASASEVEVINLYSDSEDNTSVSSYSDSQPIDLAAKLIDGVEVQRSFHQFECTEKNERDIKNYDESLSPPTTKPLITRLKDIVNPFDIFANSK